MQLPIADILDPATVKTIADALTAETFEDGSRTAGRAARLVKDNEQARPGIRNSTLGQMVEKALLRHPLFKAAAQPRQISRMLFSRYQSGMEYGSHVDEAFIGGGRTDLSFTLFLSDPDGYEGGALVIEGHEGDTAIKLPAGSLFLYPSTSLHRVEAVNSGERLAAVGWVTSRVRSVEARSILFDLDMTLAEVFAREGKSATYDRLSRARTNLLRLHGE